MSAFEFDDYKPEHPAHWLFPRVQDVINRGQNLFKETYGVESSPENGVQFIGNDFPLKIQDSDTASIMLVGGYDQDGVFDIIMMQLYKDGSPFVTEKDQELYEELGASQLFNFYNIFVSAESPPLIMNEDVTDRILTKIFRDDILKAVNSKNLFDHLPKLKEIGAVRELDEAEIAELCNFLESADFDLDAMQRFNDAD